MITFDTGPMPLNLCMCLDEEDFQCTMVNMGLSRTFMNDNPYSSCHFFESGDQLTAILCFNLPVDAHPAMVAGHVVLELNRALKELWDYIGEFKPGIEIEGRYLMSYTASIMALILEKDK
jgi:hypothetical protein